MIMGSYEVMTVHISGKPKGHASCRRSSLGLSDFRHKNAASTLNKALLSIVATVAHTSHSQHSLC